MSVLYLLSADSSARKDGNRIIAEKSSKVVASVPIRSLESVVLNENGKITTAALFFLMEHSVPVFFIDWAGKVQGELKKDAFSIPRLFQQFQSFQNASTRIDLIREVIAEKIENQQRILQQYAASQKNDRLSDAAKKLKTYKSKVRQMEDEDSLRGLEGTASRCYFGTFSILLDQAVWKWKGRSQHPAKDSVNALLNYGYAFLEREVRIGVTTAGLDARIGFFHANNGRKDSLVYDLMELFRQPVTDRFVLSLLNRKTLKPEHFIKENHAVRLEDEARKIWCARYEEYMDKPYKEYDGDTTRQMIFARLRRFALRIHKEA